MGSVTVVGTLDGAAAVNIDLMLAPSGDMTPPVTSQLNQGILGGGVFDLPLQTDPAQWMNLFLGKVTDLVTVDLPDVSFDTGNATILSFPIFPLVRFVVPAGFAADFNFDFGFDTRGLITDGLTALDGLYLIDGPGGGNHVGGHDGYGHLVECAGSVSHCDRGHDGHHPDGPERLAAAK